MYEYESYFEKLNDLYRSIRHGIEYAKKAGEPVYTMAEDWRISILDLNCLESYQYEMLKNLINDVYAKTGEDSYSDHAPVASEELLTKAKAIAEEHNNNIQKIKDYDGNREILEQIKIECDADGKVEKALKKIEKMVAEYRRRYASKVTNAIREEGELFIKDLFTYMDKNLTQPYKKYCLEQELKSYEEKEGQTKGEQERKVEQEEERE